MGAVSHQVQILALPAQAAAATLGRTMSATQTLPPRAGAFDDLARSFRGELVLPGSAGYDAARAIWNGAIDRRPACVARCAGVADVVAAVRFGRDRQLPVAVRSGGHGVGGHAL